MDTPGVISAIPLASRFLRLVAFLIDGALIVGLIIPLYAPMMLGFSGVELPQDAAAQLGAIQPYLPYVAAAAILFFLVQVLLLTLRGQTVGKWICRMKIVKQSTLQNGGFLTNVVLRELLSSIASLLPPILPLFLVVDSLFIFRSDRRCLHDMVAGTIVVRA